jgi:hypothetical protein
MRRATCRWFLLRQRPAPTVSLSNRAVAYSHKVKAAIFFQSYRYAELMGNGTAFTSGDLLGISPLSTFLHGDAFFEGITLEAVGLVSKGMVLVSAVVLQRSPAASSGWIPIFISKPERLSMSCAKSSLLRKKSGGTLWDCASPRVIDVLFPMPGTGILSTEELQLNVLYSIFDPTSRPEREKNVKSSMQIADAVFESASSFVFSNSEELTKRLPSLKHFSGTNKILGDAVRRSFYIIEHESSLYEDVGIAVRLLTISATLLFSAVWFWSLGSRGFCAAGSKDCCCHGVFWWLRPHRKGDDELLLTGVKKGSTLWWDSPWIVFPERRYLMLLLAALLFIQNPVFAVAYIWPSLYSMKNTHRLADSMVGIGVHLFLLVWLCLLESLRYHTADVARRRAKHQRQVLELRRAAKYMAQADQTNYGSDEGVARYTSDYYERYGDVYGSGSAGMLHMRLLSDPCGDSWADFLLLKLLLFAFGAISVTITSLCRYPTAAESSSLLTPQLLYRYNAFYATSSIMQLSTLVLWVVSIFYATLMTGRELRKEPFLSTRPAQLAYRVLLGITILGLGALVVPFLSDLSGLLGKWTGWSSDLSGSEMAKHDSTLDVLLHLLVKLGENFPYSGTAASVGPGKMLFATACALIAAFIFLPCQPFFNDHEEHEHPGNKSGTDTLFSSLALQERMRQRMDKRSKVSLARNTWTWRVFPLPIKRLGLASKLLSETSFYLDPLNERSIAYFGRYTPVFCLELACWLLEASWQVYYSPGDYSLDDWAPGRMSLDRIGLRLEHSLFDESTHTQAFIASNMSSQVDGEEDSIVVIAFRGTASSRNIQTDLKSRIIPVPEQVTGISDEPAFRIYPGKVEYRDPTGRFWDTMSPRGSAKVQRYSPNKYQDDEITKTAQGPSVKRSAFSTASSVMKAIIRAIPVAQQTLPCVHAGFLEAYLNVRKQVLEGVLQVLQRQLNNAVARSKFGDPQGKDGTSLVLPKIYICGHSLGGSLGQLLALDIASNCEVVVEAQPTPETSIAEELFQLPLTPNDSQSNDPTSGRARFFSFDDADGTQQPKPRTLALQPPIAVYTYGQTRTGNRAFATVYKQRVPHTFRVANERDAFTTLPTPLLCGGRYKHAGLEVVLDEGCTGNTLVGPTVVETLFRFSKMRTSVAAHSMERYRDCLVSAMRPEELEEYYRGHGTLVMREHRPGLYDDEATDISAAVADEDLPPWLTQVRRSVAEP